MLCVAGSTFGDSTSSVPPWGTSFDPATRDIDVLVEFAEGPGFDHFTSYFGLKEGLEDLFGRPVDLISAESIRNPYFRRQVMHTRRLLYAA